MLPVTWEQLKGLNDTNPLVYKLSYIELAEKYIIWMSVHGLRLVCDNLFKDSADALLFEANYKPNANQPEANLVRITTNMIGRRMHARYITFCTANLNSYDNTDWKNRDFGDLTYSMMDSNGNMTTDNSQAIETWIDWEPVFDFEVSGGWIYIPTDLPGTDLDLWEAHVLGVPDVPAALGGEIPFISNPRLKWIRGQVMQIDASLNPAEMKYHPTLHTNKIRFIIKHPQGVQCEMQLNIKVFK
jgi:hypothetical protein